MANLIPAGEEAAVTNTNHFCVNELWTWFASEEESFAASFQDFMLDFCSVAADILMICGWILRIWLVVKFAIKRARELKKRIADRKSAKKNCDIPSCSQQSDNK